MSDELPLRIRRTRASRIFPLRLTGLLMGLSFGLGATVTAFIAVRLFQPLAATGLLTGLAALSLAAAI